jgi:hypothetical protein
LRADAAGVGAGEAEESGETAGGKFFDDGKGRGDLVDVELWWVRCSEINKGDEKEDYGVSEGCGVVG